MSHIRLAREFVSQNVAPINTVIFCTTGILIPLFDFLRPRAPLLTYAALAVGLVFLLAIAARGLGYLKQTPSALLVGFGVCATLFSVGAVASYQHAAHGGVLAETVPSLQPLQASLLGLHADLQATNDSLNAQRILLADIKSGRSDDPRVTLHNIGIPWDFGKLQRASADGDLRVMELFLSGGMPAYDSSYGGSLAGYVISAKVPNAAAQLALLEKHGFALHGATAITKTPDANTPTSLYALAVEAGNKDAADYLLTKGFNKTDYDSWLVEKKRRHPRESGYWM